MAPTRNDTDRAPRADSTLAPILGVIVQAIVVLGLAHLTPAMASFIPLEKNHGKGEGPAVSPPYKKLLDCSEAAALQVDSSVQGSTVGLVSNVDQYGCSDWDLTGGEMVYSLSLAAPTMFEVRLTADADLDVAILGTCDPDAGCLLVADTGFQTTDPVTGDYFIVVDGFEGAEGDFTLDIIETDPRIVDAMACEAATPLSCATGSTISGDTCGGEDQLRALGCELFPSSGPDQWYRVTVEPGGSLQVDLTMPEADAVLWILAGCGEASQCLDHSDVGLIGEQESVSYSNGGAENQTVFLVVDSYGAASCSGYEAILDCNGVIVPTQSLRWSGLKANYRLEEK